MKFSNVKSSQAISSFYKHQQTGQCLLNWSEKAKTLSTNKNGYKHYIC